VLRQFGFVVVVQASRFGQAPDLAPVTQVLDVSVHPGAAYYFVRPRQTTGAKLAAFQRGLLDEV
jgi:hypothetical protein